MAEKIDVLAFAAHPDDIELAAAGTLLKMRQEGKKIGIIDLTRGELGSRGSADLRDQEAAASSKILGLHVRENLGMEDGFFAYNEENQRKIIKMVRKYRPDTVLVNAIGDRHPDHGKGSRLVSDALFLSGLRRIETELDGEAQEHWRPKAVYHYIQDYYIKPDFVVDVSDVWAQKEEAIRAFGSQFFNPNEEGPKTPISGPDFLEFLKARAREFGRQAGFEYGEGFTTERFVGIKSLSDIH